MPHGTPCKLARVTSLFAILTKHQLRRLRHTPPASLLLLLIPAPFVSSIAAQQSPSAPVAHIAQITPLAAPALPIAAAAGLATHASVPTAPLIVVGFSGGFVKSTDAFHGEIRLALRLRKEYGAAIASEIFENHHGDDACREILRLIDAATPAANPAAPAVNRSLIENRSVSNNRRSARVILYGHSWGASEADDVARRLQQAGVPVLLLVEVDGVEKRRQDDSVIPSNVAEAINFYQTDGLLHGRSRITAADPAATRILGNVHLTYKHNDVPTPGYSWFARHFTHRHIEIENDPRVWDRVESMVAETLADTGARVSTLPATAN